MPLPDADNNSISGAANHGGASKPPVRQPGLRGMLTRRLRWYKQRIQKNNWWVGRYVEIMGDTVKIRGTRFSVKSPLIQTRQKSWMYFGVYEVYELNAVERFVRPNDAVIELGASIGVVSSLTNRRLADPTRHLVLEANPRLIETLEHNRERTGSRFGIRHAALGYGADKITFHVNDSFLSGGVEREGDAVTVPTVSLGELIEDLGESPVVLVCDIEGAELDLVEHELDVICDRVDLIIMETHPRTAGSEPTDTMSAKLVEAGYSIVSDDHFVLVFAHPRRGDLGASEMESSDSVSAST